MIHQTEKITIIYSLQEQIFKSYFINIQSYSIDNAFLTP